MIRNLQSLRGIAAILIFYHHYFGPTYRFTASFGDLGVVFFMMLSGFVTALSVNKKIERNLPLPSVKKFMMGRLLKIYPQYLIFWLAAIVFLPYSGTLLGKCLGILMLQSWVPVPSIYFSGNAVAWFISDLFFCYLLFIPLMRLIFLGNRITRRLFLLIYFTVYFLTVAFIPGEYVHAIVYINPVMQLSNFILGMLLCKAYIHIRSNEKDYSLLRYGIIPYLLSISIIVVIIQCYIYKDVPERLSYGCYWWLIVGVIILTSSLTDKCQTVFSRIIHNRFLLWIGSVSFTFYLIHYIAIKNWSLYFHSHHLMTGMAQSFALILILFGICYVMPGCKPKG